MSDRPAVTEQKPVARCRCGAGIRLWAGNLALLVASCALSLLVAEVLVRALEPQQPILLRSDIWLPHDGLGVVQAPDLDTRVNTGEREVRLLTDGDGHRIGTGPRPVPAVRILALGDSYLAALQVDYELTMTALTERRLSRSLGAEVEIVNAGVGGWGPSHYLLKARRELARRRFDRVVVFLYPGNDVQAKRVDHFPARQAAGGAFRWPRRLSRPEIVYGLLYPFNNVLERRSHLFLLVKNRLWFLAMRLGLSARYLPPALLRANASSESWQVTGETCRMIADEARGHGVEVLFVLLPGICEVDREVAAITARAAGFETGEIDPDQPSRLMARELSRRGLPVLDTAPALRAAHAAGRMDLYGRVDIHFGAGGHHVVADLLTPLLLADHLH